MSTSTIQKYVNVYYQEICQRLLLINMSTSIINKYINVYYQEICQRLLSRNMSMSIRQPSHLTNRPRDVNNIRDILNQ